jgi:hypothetical protein
MASAIFLDAVVIRLILRPPVLQLCGETTWRIAASPAGDTSEARADFAIRPGIELRSRASPRDKRVCWEELGWVFDTDLLRDRCRKFVRWSGS